MPGEDLVTFADIVNYEVVKGDDVLAAFKFTRYNNYKPNLYNTLAEYEQPAYY